MKRIILTASAVMVLALALVATTGCTWVRLQDRPETKTTTENRSFTLEGATRVRTELRIGVGQLTVSSDDTTGNVLSADFTYAPQDWRPDAHYSVDGSSGVMVVKQPTSSGVPAFMDVKNDWNVRLGMGVPTDLVLELGVGRTDADLRRLDITDLDVQMGVGDTTIDLSGPRTSDLSGRIQAGVGKLTLRLPRNVGVRVSGREDGVGHYSADGFVAHGNSWQNEAYSSGSGPKIEIDLQRGVGDVTLVLVD